MKYIMRQKYSAKGTPGGATEVEQLTSFLALSSKNKISDELRSFRGQNHTVADMSLILSYC